MLENRKPDVSNSWTVKIFEGRLRWLAPMALVVAVAVGSSLMASPGGFSRGVEPAPNRGRWVNPTPARACTMINPSWVCAEFIEEEERSLHSGTFCCLEASEVYLGLWSSCQLAFRLPPREGEE